MQLTKATIEDAREIMGWFPDKASVIRWGSPYTRYPLREETFFEDIYWDRIQSITARKEDGRLLGFGQYYPKLGRCHLARLVINPDFRGQGEGERFVSALMDLGSAELDFDEFSLYVMTENLPAYYCYRHLGFELAPYPDGDAKLENCVFMIARRGSDDGAVGVSREARLLS
jgi:ribosomal protein S18 acetylase RimI-like enzyme